MQLLIEEFKQAAELTGMVCAMLTEFGEVELLHAKQTALAAMLPEDRAAALAAMSPDDRAVALAAMPSKIKAAALLFMSSKDREALEVMSLKDMATATKTLQYFKLSNCSSFSKQNSNILLMFPLFCLVPHTRDLFDQANIKSKRYGYLHTRQSRRQG